MSFYTRNMIGLAPLHRLRLSAHLCVIIRSPPLYSHRRHNHSSRPDPPSLADSAGGFFASMRWKAANALTAALPTEQRDELMRQLQPGDASSKTGSSASSDANVDIDDERIMDIKKTIAEAVAEARAQESKLQEEKWERERAKIEEEAEMAARARMEQELLIQKRRLGFEQWQQDLRREQEQQQQQSSDEVVEANGSLNKNAEAMERTIPADDDHPVLGSPVVDLGYKRVHLVPASKLTNIDVWEKQRVYRHDRAKAMANDKLKSLHLGMPGVICLHEDSNGTLRIIDGQHRIGMMSVLEQKVKLEELDLGRILVEVYPQKKFEDEDHAKDIFMEINKAEPIKLVDMPGIAKASDRKIITEAADLLKEQFPDMFSPSQKCRAPHLNIDNLRDALFAADVIKRHGLKSSKAIVDWMMSQNKLLEERYKKEEEQSKIAKTAMAKALKFNFYLGIDPTWYYN